VTSRRSKALAALVFVPAFAAGARASSLPSSFSSAQAAVRAELASERLWAALAGADELAARGSLSPAQRVWALREAARLRTRVGDEAGAEKDLRDALAAAPGDTALLEALARLLRRDRPEEALRAADQAGADELAGELRLELGDSAGARVSLTRALARGEDLDALAAMARAQDDKTAAGQYAERARSAAGREPKRTRGAALRLVGRLWSDLGGEDRAARAFADALAEDPDDLDALQSLRRLPPASSSAPAPSPEAPAPASIAAADVLLEDAADEPEWRQAGEYRAISAALLAMGPKAKERAYAAATRALALDGPRVADALLLMRAATSAQPVDDPGGIEFAGEAFRAVFAERLRLGDRDGARATVERGLRLLPDSVQLRLDLARLRLEDGRPSEALQELERLPPGDTPTARFARADGDELRARAWHALKDDAAAERSLQAAVAESPVERDALRRAAALEAEIGLSTAAFAHLDRLAAISATPEERADADSRRREAERALEAAARR